MTSLKRSTPQIHDQDEDGPVRKKQRVGDSYNGLDVLEVMMASFRDIQKKEQNHYLKRQQELKKCIAELKNEINRYKERIHQLQYKLNSNVDFRAHDTLQETEFCLTEMENDHQTEVQTLEWQLEQKYSEIERKQEILEQKDSEIERKQECIDGLLSRVKYEEHQYVLFMKQYDVRGYEFRREIADLMTELQVKDHQHEETRERDALLHRDQVAHLLHLQHNDLIAKLHTRNHNIIREVQLKAKQTELEELKTKLLVKDYEHEGELEEIEKKFNEKMKQQYSFRALSRLDKQQMSEIQKHLRELLSRDSLCSICVDRDKDTVLNPCGHQFCVGCCDRFGRCPICKGNIESKISLMRS